MAIKKMREIATEERNTKIESMGMDELKRYLCMKNYQNPEKCPDCPGKKNCRAGQRAIVLLNEMEKQKMEEQMNEQMENAQVKARSRKDIAEEKKQIFITALQQPDMIQYLIDNYGNNRNSAREKLKYWRSAFPDIAEQYGFNEKFDALSGKMPRAMRQTADAKREGAIERYREAAAKDDPIAFMMDKYGIPRDKAVHNFYQWKKRYGEIKKEDLEVEKPMEDEVSVEDFLKENNVAVDSVEAGSNPKAVPSEAIAEEVKNEPKVNISPEAFTKSEEFYGELNAKFHELEMEKERIQNRLKWIEKAQDALAMTANLFNPESAIAKDLLRKSGSWG